MDGLFKPGEAIQPTGGLAAVKGHIVEQPFAQTRSGGRMAHSLKGVADFGHAFVWLRGLQAGASHKLVQRLVRPFPHSVKKSDCGGLAAPFFQTGNGFASIKIFAQMLGQTTRNGICPLGIALAQAGNRSPEQIAPHPRFVAGGAMQTGQPQRCLRMILLPVQHPHEGAFRVKQFARFQVGDPFVVPVSYGERPALFMFT